MVAVGVGVVGLVGVSVGVGDGDGGCVGFGVGLGLGFGFGFGFGLATGALVAFGFDRRFFLGFFFSVSRLPPIADAAPSDPQNGVFMVLCSNHR
ncbi:hypothetical protein ACFY5D_17620 [Paeniglutamicibacter sp. NPDC012692]|uniref:hypothetical protein n=1 Tax=Paeniglutamicibacter sp. NPDC012692 TaxID=3364388 RepID=UPI0036B46864